MHCIGEVRRVEVRESHSAVLVAEVTARGGETCKTLLNVPNVLSAV